MISDDEKVEIFNRHRARLFGIAYRMFGVHSDAEDVLQEAYIRWHKTDADEIEIAEAWLVTVVSRLSIDRLRKLKSERETYIGPWLPEPLIASESPTAADKLEFASNVSMAFMVLLERLSPVERAAFLLHDVFDFDYSVIARIVGKTETALRQLIHRARERVRTGKPRFEADEKMRENLIRKFAVASETGDEKTLLALFADEVSMTSDGGGKVKAARKIVRGNTKLAHALSMIGTKSGAEFQHEIFTINGEPGLLTFRKGKIFGATTFEFSADGKISAIYRVMNPDKLEQITNFPARN